MWFEGAGELTLIKKIKLVRQKRAIQPNNRVTDSLLSLFSPTSFLPTTADLLCSQHLHRFAWKKMNTAHMQLHVSVVHTAQEKVCKQLFCYNTSVLMPWQERLIRSARMYYRVCFLAPGFPLGQPVKMQGATKIQHHTHPWSKCIS